MATAKREIFIGLVEGTSLWWGGESSLLVEFFPFVRESANFRLVRRLLPPHGRENSVIPHYMSCREGCRSDLKGFLGNFDSRIISMPKVVLEI